MKTLDNVKVGDKVVLRYCAGGGQDMVEYTTITKVTKTQVTVEKKGMRFLKKNGWKIGECQKMRGWFTFLYTEEQFNR